MKKILALLVIAIMVISSCNKDSSDSGFTNGLTFGTGVNYTNFTLTGEGGSFSTVPGNVVFRLESETDFNSNPVKFVILKSGTTYSTNIYSSNPVPTGHIFITALNFSTAGQYSVTAYIQKVDREISVAAASFQMN